MSSVMHDKGWHCKVNVPDNGEHEQKERPFKEKWLETEEENFKNCKRSAVDGEKC